MTAAPHKQRVADEFSVQANDYDAAAHLQFQVAEHLAGRIAALNLPRNPRILEIGCGTGFLSTRLVDLFPDAEFVITDIAPDMIERCKQRVGLSARFQILDAERPQNIGGPFDLIAGSLVLQWFEDLEGSITRLSNLLAPRGRLCFATLLEGTLAEWGAAHRTLNLEAGTPVYPRAENFPWPSGTTHESELQDIRLDYASGHDLARNLKSLGAGIPAPGHKPLGVAEFRRVLDSTAQGITITWRTLYGEVVR